MRDLERIDKLNWALAYLIAQLADKVADARRRGRKYEHARHERYAFAQTLATARFLFTKQSEEDRRAIIGECRRIIRCWREARGRIAA